MCAFAPLSSHSRGGSVPLWPSQASGLWSVWKAALGEWAGDRACLRGRLLPLLCCWRGKDTRLDHKGRIQIFGLLALRCLFFFPNTLNSTLFVAVKRPGTILKDDACSCPDRLPWPFSPFSTGLGPVCRFGRHVPGGPVRPPGGAVALSWQSGRT